MSRARLVYEELLTGAGVGELISYQAIGDLLELDPVTDRAAVQAAARQAAKWLLVEQDRAIDVMPGVGYRVVQAREQIDLYRRHRKKSERSLKRGRASLEHIRREELDDVERRLVDNGISQTALQLDMYRRFKRDQDRLARGLAIQAERGERTAEEVARLHDRIARLEAGLTDDTGARGR